MEFSLGIDGSYASISLFFSHLLSIVQIGGRSNLHNELLCRFTFPEKAGALSKAVDAFSPRWNISLIHYRAQGQIGANVLVGIQVPQDEFDEFQSCADRLGYEYVVESLNDAFKLITH